MKHANPRVVFPWQVVRVEKNLMPVRFDGAHSLVVARGIEVLVDGAGSCDGWSQWEKCAGVLLPSSKSKRSPILLMGATPLLRT